MVDHHGTRDDVEQGVLQRLREIFGQHPWLVATEYVPGAVGLAGAVRDITEQPVLAVGATEGMALPDVGDSVEMISLGMAPGESMVDTMHRGQALLADPTAEHQAMVERWDEDRSARAIVSFTSVAGQTMGRQTFGARPAQWRALEDKLGIESLWAAAGVAVAPSRQVDASDRAALFAAHDALATSAGTVWAGDNSSGWHGGGAGTFWVPDRATAEQRSEQLDRFDRVRVMPFVEGVPASMHGMVVPDGGGGFDVITFRPCEMLVLRDRTTHTFTYCRSATFWDPDPADRELMVDTTRRIGEELLARVNYRGVFTVDGVLGADGFVPSEVNTRYGAALRARHPTERGGVLNLVLLNMAVIEGRFDDVDLRPLESIVTAALDDERFGNAFVNCSARPEQERTADVRRAADGQLVLDETTGEEPSESEEHGGSEDHTTAADSTKDAAGLATVQWTTMGSDGGVLNVTVTGQPVGQPVAPLLAEIIELVNERWSPGITPLEPATVVR